MENKTPEEDSTLNHLEKRLEVLESEIAKHRDKKKLRIFSRFKKYIASLFSRQNLELFLSLSALAISIATAAYLLAG
mgnify:CR=1 FL=1|tara:strand:+ start:81 stop:311 length:231 start_codon:yes stop_codon:yes gene_type:complete